MMKRLISALALGYVLTAPASATAQAPAPARPAPSGDTLNLIMVYVQTTDLERSKRFYAEVFGLTTVQPFGGEQVLVLPNGLSRIVLRRATAPGANSMFTLRVPDIDAVMARVEKAGGRITQPARGSTNRAGVRLGWIADPDGAAIELIQPGPPR